MVNKYQVQTKEGMIHGITLDGSPEIGTHVRSNLSYLIC